MDQARIYGRQWRTFYCIERVGRGGVVLMSKKKKKKRPLLTMKEFTRVYKLTIFSQLLKNNT